MVDELKVAKDAEGRRAALYTGALLCAGAGIGLLAAMWIFDGRSIEREGKGETSPVADVEITEPAAPVERIVTRTRRAAESRRDAPSAPATGTGGADPEPEIKAGDYIEALRAAGETGGIAAFNPPGTDPIHSGIVVPDDYELPPGYARRYQTTDDGKDVPPILMFSPGYEFLDADGNPIPLPDDMIVPPEMAPPGMPIRVLEPGKYEGR